MEPRAAHVQPRPGGAAAAVAAGAGRVGIVRPAYCGSVEAYRAMAAMRRVVIDATARYDKREKALHRCTIAGPNGPQRLTVPLHKPAQWHTTRIADLRVSGHGDWPHLHWGALEAAYGRTPYFEYYADELRPLLLAAPERRLVDLVWALHGFCLDVACIPRASHVLADTPAALAAALAPAAADMDPAAAPADSACGAVAPVDVAGLLAALPPRPYYQTWAERFGFTPSLSVLDLIFNLGPETALYLGSSRRAD